MIVSRPLTAIAALLLTMATAASAAAQAWPEKTVRIIVSNAAGGPTDALARILANEFSVALKATFIVENKPGAASNIGIAHVAQAEPDGHTLLVTTGAMTINPALSDKLSYDPPTHFAPISLLATSPLIFASAPSLPVRSMADLVKLAKEKPDLLNYSTPGRGTSANMIAELIKHRYGAGMAHVPHSGAGLAAQAVLTGAVQVTSTAIESAQPLVENGQLIGLAVTGEKRWRGLPQVPTLMELGMADMPIEFTVGFYAPAKVPAPIVNRLAELTAETLRRPDIAQRLATFQMEIVASSPQALRERMIKELAFYRDLVGRIGLKQ
jgi:tripartite-type tricarboxylate transporter receptor subunit TctC